MIKYHPNQALLRKHAAGELPASISLAVSIHCQMCEECQQTLNLMTDEIAQDSFDEVSFETADTQPGFEASMEDMLANIMATDDISDAPMSKQIELQVKDQSYTLPRALSNVPMSQWRTLGKVSRSTLALDEGPIHTHLLHIDRGGEVPCHTHKGFEITLLLDGSFEDEMGRYHKGDFILLDKQHNHQPKTEEGCLCFTVADDALHFTKGIHKLFNPIGGLIY